MLDGSARGSIVLIGSHAPIEPAPIEPAVIVPAVIVPAAIVPSAPAQDGDELLTGGAAAAFIGDARPLTDDYAPVDQLLSQARD